MKNNNSNKCVNDKNPERHEYHFGETKFIVRVFNKDGNKDRVISKLSKMIKQDIATKN